MSLSDFLAYATGKQHIPAEGGVFVAGIAMSKYKEKEEKQEVKKPTTLLEGMEARRERDRISYARRVEKDPHYSTRKRLRARGYPADVVAKMTAAEIAAIGAEGRRESFRKSRETRMNKIAGKTAT